MMASESFATALRALTLALREQRAPSLIIGGVAVIAHGNARLTKDIDASIDGTSVDIEDLLQHFEGHGITPRISGAAAFARRHQVLLVRHDATGVPIDVSFAFIPWELEALLRGETVVQDGIEFRVPTPEDLLIYKLVASRPKDVEDATAIAQMHVSRIEFARVRQVLREFCAVLEDDSRLTTLDRIEASTKAR